MQCANGHDNSPEMRFCGRCGQDLNTATDSTEQQTVETDEESAPTIVPEVATSESPEESATLSRHAGDGPLPPPDPAIGGAEDQERKRKITQRSTFGIPDPFWIGVAVVLGAVVVFFAVAQSDDDLEPIPSQMSLNWRCSTEEVTGTVENGSDERVDILIEITFENPSGVQVGDSLASVLGLQPGQVGIWETSVFDNVAYDSTCEARVTSVFIAD